jgi:predicted glycosyltransferase
LVNNNNLSRNLTSQYNLANNANNHKDLKIFERLLNYFEDIEIFIFVINENIEQIFEKHDKLRIDPIKMSASLKLVKYTHDKT